MSLVYHQLQICQLSFFNNIVSQILLVFFYDIRGKRLFDPNIMSIIIVKCEQKIKLFFVIKVIEYHIAVKWD